MIYQALDKLINDYQKYKDNFPQDYYVEFGRYMVESGIQCKTGILYAKILGSLMDCCKLITESKIFGDKEFNNGSVAIFHLYENYVPKFEGDENGLDKVKHFVYSARLCFMKSAPQSLIGGYMVEVRDWLKQKGGGDSTGFDKGDIAANKQGIEYGNELRLRYGKII